MAPPKRSTNSWRPLTSSYTDANRADANGELQVRALRRPVAAQTVDRVDRKTKGPHRARQVVLDGLVGSLKIAVAQRFGNAAMLVHDRRHALRIASHRLADHPHLTVAQ